MAAHASRSKRADPPPNAAGGTGFGLYVGHLATVWGIALSNVLHGLTLLWTIAAGWRRARGRGAADGDAPTTRRRIPPLPTLPDGAAKLLTPLLAYGFCLTASVALSQDRAVSAEHLREWIALSTLPLGLLWVRGTAAVRRTIDVLLVMAVLAALYGLGQLYTTGVDLDRRIPGPFSHYQTFAGVLLAGLMLGVARLITGGRWRRQPLTWIAVGILAWALFASLTRGPWVAAGLTLGGYVLVRSRRRAPLLLAGLVAFALLAPRPWLARAASIGDWRDASNYDRLCMVDAGLYMISERPLLGIGPGLVGARYPIYRHPTAPRYTTPHLHNTFVQLAAERGLASLAAYAWLMVVGLRLARRACRRQTGRDGEDDLDLPLGALFALVAFNLAGLFEDSWRDTEVQRLMLFLLALPLCLDRPAPAIEASTADADAQQTPEAGLT
ncbi:MAG: O-antigen ligase family protein [Acidobacteriota bacterium]